jgi:acid phosphatase (class A)
MINSYSILRHRLQCLSIALLILSAAATPVAADNNKHGATPHYLNAAKISWVPLIAPPPAVDSIQQERDLETVLDMQAVNRSGERHDKAIADSEASCFRFADVLGIAFDAKQLPITAAFLNRAADEANAATGIVKRHWQRPRPFVISDKVERFADIAPRPEPQDAAALHSFEYSSYPSGHAAYGMICAMVLTQLVPEQQAPLFKRAVDYGESRMIVGAHFPSDLVAGRMVATAAVTLMSQNSAYQHDLKAASKELRRALELAAPPAPITATTRM